MSNNDLIDRQFRVLDHGFIRVVDIMGDDAAIVQAARVSYGPGTKSLREDRGLIRYLLRHRHTSPFEQCSIKLHVKMPIFVARQWVRHRTAKLNEVSGRYSELPAEFYVPDASVVAAQATDNKQGRGDTFTFDAANEIRATMDVSAVGAFDDYQSLLKQGVARELARTVLPLSTYTEMYWKIDLHNLLHFLKLRLDEHAQYEIRVYAEKIFEIVQDWVPFAAEAFSEYVLHAVTLSQTEYHMLRARLVGDVGRVADLRAGMSTRELADFNRLFPTA